MADKSFLIDTTRCTACRGCQVACKNWNQNPASATKNHGSHQNPPDLIVLDVMMPEKDGYAVCSELKKDKKYAQIPILMLTAVADHVSSTRYSHYNGMSMEADDYLPKPASAEDITQSVKSLLNM